MGRFWGGQWKGLASALCHPTATAWQDCHWQVGLQGQVVMLASSGWGDTGVSCYAIMPSPGYSAATDRSSRLYKWEAILFEFPGWAGPVAEADPGRPASLKQSWAATDLTDMVGLIAPNRNKHLASSCYLMILQNARLSDSAILWLGNS